MFTVARAARLAGGRLTSGDGAAEVSDAAKVTIDSRKAAAGDLFVALVGTRTDGHRFLAAAAAQGAAAVLVHDARAAEGLPPSCAVIVVDDTLSGLQRLAAGYRSGFSLGLAAISGSCGKTTTKEMAAAALQKAGLAALVTQGNLNNHIGLPLTLLALRPAHKVAVVELGINHAGEMDLLCSLCRPTVGLVTNVGATHLQGLKNADGVAHEKGRLFAAVKGTGTAVVNRDDPRVVRETIRHKAARTVTYSARTEVPADVSITAGADGALTLKVADRTGRLALFSAAAYQRSNAAAAAALCHALGVGFDAIAEGLAAFTAPAMRGREVTTPAGAVVIDDSYNANPLAVRAAVAALMAGPKTDGQPGGRTGRRVVVIADMLELGPEAPRLHRETGAAIAELKPDRLVCVGRLGAEIAKGAKGLPDVRTAPDAEAAAGHLSDLGPGDVVLVKGSRALAMERLVHKLTAAEGVRA
jgi:UDP-N-acetylmuramoyl-tripeptide--D-alanyl-D-alanine ligase